MDKFSDNIYVVDYNERNTTTQENTSLLHKEENETAIDPSKPGKS
jgi:predicted ATP-grasp superfamily ATP-dependent carboligase